jgi:hypothetical protein
LAFVVVASMPVAAQTSAGNATKGTSKARLEVEPETHDFGRVKQDQKLAKEFLLRNVGTEDLTILRISTSCGCTAAEPEVKVIRPGASTSLKVIFETRRYEGQVERTVAVATNDARRNKLIKLKAFVETSN